MGDLARPGIKALFEILGIESDSDHAEIFAATRHSCARLSVLNHTTDELNTMTTYQPRRYPGREDFMKIKTVFCAALLMFVPLMSAAQSPPPDQVANIIRAAQTATSAEVFIVPDNVLTLKQIDLHEVPMYGCGYTVEERRMPELLAIINNAKVEQSELHIRYLDIRVLITLRGSSGLIATMAFKRHSSYVDDKVHGTVNGASSAVARDFSDQMHRWVKSLGPPTHRKMTTCP